MAHLLSFTPARNSIVSLINYKSRELLIKLKNPHPLPGAECFECALLILLSRSLLREQLRLHVLRLREGTLGNTWVV